MMSRERSLCTLSSYDNIPDWSSMASVNYEYPFYQNSPCPQFITFDPDLMSNSHQEAFLYDHSAAGDMTPQNFYSQNAEDSQTITDENYMTFSNLWSQSEAYPEQSFGESYTLPMEDGNQIYFGEPFQPQFMQYGSLTVTDYGAVALLLRHLIRVDVTHQGAVSICNFPATSVTTLNSEGNKCYIKHPNGLVFLDGSVIHIMTGNDRMVKMTHRGITFSSFSHSLAYFVDESGTKTTTGKFTDLSQDLTMDVFFEGNWQNHENAKAECYGMASEATYENLPDGSELWNIGRIRVKQDKWGEVSIVQNDKDITIATSPTIRSVNVESASVSINIDCFSRNYLSVRKGNCLVASAHCGLIVQNRSQKAGLDRRGKLILF